MGCGSSLNGGCLVVQETQNGEELSDGEPKCGSSKAFLSRIQKYFNFSTNTPPIQSYGCSILSPRKGVGRSLIRRALLKNQTIKDELQQLQAKDTDIEELIDTMRPIDYLSKTFRNAPRLSFQLIESGDCVFYLVHRGGCTAWSKNSATDKTVKPTHTFTPGAVIGELEFFGHSGKCTNDTIVDHRCRKTRLYEISETDYCKAIVGKLRLLEQGELLSCLTGDQRHALKTAILLKKYGNGSMLLDKEKPSCLYIIVAGVVEVSSARTRNRNRTHTRVSGANSGDVIEGVLGPGDYFGAEHLLGLTSDPISARALSKVYVAVVPKDTFFDDEVFFPAREAIKLKLKLEERCAQRQQRLKGNNKNAKRPSKERALPVTSAAAESEPNSGKFFPSSADAEDALVKTARPADMLHYNYNRSSYSGQVGASKEWGVDSNDDLDNGDSNSDNDIVMTTAFDVLSMVSCSLF